MQRIFALLFLVSFAVTVLPQAAEAQKKTSLKSTKKQPLVLIETEFGNLKIQLYEKTPLHRDNFMKLVKEGYFDDLLFHRVISNFMIQGGDPDSRNADAGKSLGMGGPGYTVPAEFIDDYIHVKGALAAARQGDAANPAKASSGSQFYIVQGKIATDAELDRIEAMRKFKYTPEQRELYKTIGGTPFLDRDYTVFGMVVEGLDVIDKIAAVEKGRSDRPKKDVKMTIKAVKK